MLNIKNESNPFPLIKVETNQHTKKSNSYLNILDGPFFLTKKYSDTTMTATIMREILKNVFIAWKPRMSKHAGFKNVAKAKATNKKFESFIFI